MGENLKKYVAVLTVVSVAVQLAITGASAQALRKSPFGTAERDRLLTICELGRQVQAKGDAAGSRRIIGTLLEASPFPDAAMDLCQNYTIAFIKNPKNPTALRIQKKADAASAAAKK